MKKRSGVRQLLMCGMVLGFSLLSGCGEEKPFPIPPQPKAPPPISSLVITEPSQIPKEIYNNVRNASEIKTPPGVIRTGVPYHPEGTSPQSVAIDVSSYGGWGVVNVVKDENNLPALFQFLSTDGEKNKQLHGGLLGPFSYQSSNGDILYIEIEWMDPEKGWLEIPTKPGEMRKQVGQFGVYNVVVYRNGKLYQAMQVKYEGEDDMTVLEGPDWKLRFYRGWSE